MAYTLADGLEYLRAGVAAGMSVDAFAPRLSFFWAIGMNHFMEIAKMRAARMLWAKIVKKFNPKNPKSLALRTHSQTSGWSLTEQDPFNNVARTAIEAMGAALGHTQSLHTNALDEAIALPTDFSARIARNTQIYIQEETNVCREVDPWAGSYYIETLTNEIAHKAWERIEEVEKLGGMAKAIETGIPKMRIEEAAARKQARIDSGIEKIIGVNEYRLDHEAPIDILAVDNTAVRESQIKRLKELRANRDEAAVKKALEAITECVKTGKGNLLELAIEAAKVRASLGEISDACEVVVGRYKAVIRSISGVYSSEVKSDPAFEHAKELVAKFAKKEGRQPRIMIAKLGQDGHDRGAKVVATGYADIGFDVDMGPLFQTPEEAAKQAVENDVHVVGVSSLAAGHLTLVPQIIAELKKLGREDIIVIVGGVIPAQDYDELYRDGAAAIFGPGTPIATAAIKIMEILLDENVDTKKGVAELGVQAGDIIAMDPRTTVTPSGYIKSRFLDDKLSAAILLGLAREVSEGRVLLARKVYLLFTVYEEVGHGGAFVPADTLDMLSVDMGCVGDDLGCTERMVSICAKDSGGPYNYDVVSDLATAMTDDAGGALGVLNVDGGASKNDFLMQFQADMLGAPLRRPDNAETTALGAAYLAGLSTGFWKSTEELAALREGEDRFLPTFDEPMRAARLAAWHEAVSRVRS